MDPGMWQARAGRRRGHGRCGGSSRGLRGSGVVAATAAVVVDDLRNAEGITRPLLRRIAGSLVASRRNTLRRIGAGYLRIDPPVQSISCEEGEIIDGIAVDVSDEVRAEDGAHRESAG